ncbi:putative leucine-rich repeat receptor-like serine/threonine-protein kinase At2g24130 isoform X2 [Prosopis cineraria]|uniref:putative leucine-rich repeat receptor-like serine/threonine-protein kinase At2g24130 isoform X2 n=1 Tax=Prosopis cineraria TaxID=364024 RepID=UPI00240FB939|nr:putative leucine-rich repeat receptor-like serine/threonine-protein kinase At2g24130 isoform X2 [Prosopis cineraria]
MFLFFCLLIAHFSGVENAHEVNDGSSLRNFMSGIVSDPGNSLASWRSPGVHFCDWLGIKCNNVSGKVIKIRLSRKSLGGTISPALGNLSALKVLDLSENFFVGHIPKELGCLVQLEKLSLYWNLLEGKIPSELSSLHNLRHLDMGSNRLKGVIPPSLFCNSSSSLKNVDLSNNSLVGQIPLSNECVLYKLRHLLVWSNQLVGQVPPALSNCTELRWLDLGFNELSGELPSKIVGNWPYLQYLYLSSNGFVSHNGNTNLEPFFTSLVNLSNLQVLELDGNYLGGKLPHIVGGLPTSLMQLHLDENLIYGSIPPDIANLVNLTLLNLSSNQLNGSIPPNLSLMSRLERVFLSNNSLSGEIPSTLGDIQHLGLLDLSRNWLSGSIPDNFGNLLQLRRLLLYHNQLSGTIPPSLGKCVNLETLDLSRNKISGVIPTEVAALTSLKLYLNLSSNNLTGPLPLELSKMGMVLAIDLSRNNLSGRIPLQFESCIALEYLNLSGSVSIEGAFSSLTIDSFQGNDGLCGSVKGLHSCHKKHSHHLILLLILVLLFVLLFGTPMFCMFRFNSGVRKRLAISSMWNLECEEERKELNYPRISHKQLVEATGGFNASSLIGSGQFGKVYKGVLQDNTRIAVKVLNVTSASDISGSFKRECQILKKTRHRNLIRIIKICSKSEFKALVLPLMPNGSLERHLYPSTDLSQRLDLVQLVRICSDVAEGMAYLHHYSPVKVVHCDLKPSNILLDDDMTALVTDFGISRLVKCDESNPSNNTTSISSTQGLLLGSIGYIAPEYGMGKHASTKGDVYSIGVVLLEIVTCRPPTDVLIHEGSSLHDWVKRQYPHKLEAIVKQALQRYFPLSLSPVQHNKIWQDVIMELIELGLICTQNNPSMRPTMLDVALELGRLKDFLSNPSLHMIEEVTHKDDPFYCEDNLITKQH